MSADPVLPTVQLPCQPCLRSLAPASTADVIVRIVCLHPPRQTKKASEKLVLSVISDREPEPRRQFNVVRCACLKPDVPPKIGADQHRPDTGVEVTDSQRGCSDVGSLMTFAPIVADVDPAAKVCEPPNAIFTLLLLLKEGLDAVSKVPVLKVEVSTKGFSKLFLSADPLLRRVLHLQPLLPVPVVPASRAEFFALRCFKPCVNVLLLLQHRSVPHGRRAVPEGIEGTMFPC